MAETGRLKVAVIGAGAAGLVALRHLGDRLDRFQPVAFEQSPQVGGTWVYTDDIGTDSTTGLPVHSSMYRHLRVNIPIEVMAFPDFPFPDDLPSFVGHEEVRSYLIDYAQHFKLLQFIKFGHVVERVQPLKGEGGRKTDRWKIDVRELKTDCVTSDVFDAVFVCNGHYSEPRMPDISLEKFGGVVMHSHDYRDPEPFKDRRVLILGAGPSGTDIAVEISPLVNKVFLSHDETPIPASSLPEDVQQKVGIERMTSDAAVLKDGERLEADTLILCTGYRYAFPFLSDDCRPPVLHDGQVVDGLYLHLVHAAFPTMSFVGIPKKVCPFPLFDRQVLFFLATLVGAARLPTTEEMLAEVGRETEALAAAGKAPHQLHELAAAQWPYNDKLAAMGGFQPLLPVVVNLYEAVCPLRVNNLKGYRSQSFKILDQYTFKQL